MNDPALLHSVPAPRPHRRRRLRSNSITKTRKNENTKRKGGNRPVNTRVHYFGFSFFRVFVMEFPLNPLAVGPTAAASSARGGADPCGHLSADPSTRSRTASTA